MSTLQSIPLFTSQSLYGDLGLLPSEIRAIIYALVFSAGSRALARTSKALHAETQDAFHRYSVFRLYVDPYFEYEDGIRKYNRCRTYLKNVQNLRIRITPPRGFPYHWFYEVTNSKAGSGPLKMLRQYAEAMDEPKTCRVQFDETIAQPFLWEMFDAMDWLRDFERVDVELMRSNGYSKDEGVETVRQRLRPKEGSEGKPTVTVVYGKWVRRGSRR